MQDVAVPAQELTHSDRLRRKIDLAMPRLTSAGRSIHTHADVKALYPEYLFILHSLTRASVPLMEAALERCQIIAPYDPVAAGMVPYLAKHIPEERHDHWLLEDLEFLGIERASIYKRMPSPAVAAAIGSQYYWIFHHHPVALFGYMEIAEGYPPGEEQIEDLIARTGFGRGAFRSLLRHSRIDIHHRRELHQVLNGLPLQQNHVEVVGTSALQSVNLVSQALESLVLHR